MDAKDYQVIAAQVLKILKKDKKEQGGIRRCDRNLWRNVCRKIARFYARKK